MISAALPTAGVFTSLNSCLGCLVSADFCPLLNFFRFSKFLCSPKTLRGVKGSRQVYRMNPALRAEENVCTWLAPPWQSSPGAAAKPPGERSVVRPGPGLGSSHARSPSRSASSSFRSGWTQGGLARAGFSPAGCWPRGPPPHSPRRGIARASSRRRERCGPRRAWWQTPWRPPRA